MEVVRLFLLIFYSLKENILSYYVKNYDGAMGQAPGQESNGGGTYCAVASLALMDRLDDIPNMDLLLHWLVDIFFFCFIFYLVGIHFLLG